MDWSTFFTIVAQVVIATVVLVCIAGVIIAVVREAKKQ